MEIGESVGSAHGRALTILGAPVEDGAGLAGAAMGPAMLRVAGLKSRVLAGLGYEVEDSGDLALSPAEPPIASPGGAARNYASVAAWSRLVCRKTYETHEGRADADRDWRRPQPVDGLDRRRRAPCGRDGPRVVRAVARRAYRLQHPGDFALGRLHGMPAAMLCSEPGSRACSAKSRTRFVDPRNLHLFGVRSIDDGERRLLRARGVDVVDMRVLDEYGAAATIRRIIERVGSRRGTPARQPRSRLSRSRRWRRAWARPCRAARPSARRT